METRFARNMQTAHQFFLLILIVWVLTLSKKNRFLQLKANLWWLPGRLPKIYECDPIELEFVEKKNFVIPFKHINISNVHHTVDSLYLKLARASSYSAWERLSHRSNDLFCNHFRHGFLKSARVSKTIISQTYIRNENKNFGKRVS